MQINDAGLALIKEREGYKTRLPDGRCTTYYCPAGVLTIGWGCTEGIKPGDIWTEAQAEAALRRELRKHESAVMRLVSVPLNENQFSALVSFSYNVGSDNLAKSTLLKKLNKGDYPGAQAEFVKWTKANGKNLRGLAIRRAMEAALFALPTAEENEQRGDDLPMAQAVEPPKREVSTTTKVSGGLGVGTIGASLVGGPPPGVNEAVQSVGAWQSIGKTLASLGDAMWSNPVATLAIGLLAVVAVVLIPSSWGTKS